jgi:primary-amine oxidase
MACCINQAISAAAVDPLNPLSPEEIAATVLVVRAQHSNVVFNAVTLKEPSKVELKAWLASKQGPTALPCRIADVVAIGQGSKVYDAHMDLTENKLIKWELVDGVQPMIAPEDLQIVEGIIRRDEGVIEECCISGIPREDMHKVFADPWTIGFDERFGSSNRLQQALMYYRPDGSDDCQYAHPLDFCPIFDSDALKVIHINETAARKASAYQLPWQET